MKYLTITVLTTIALLTAFTGTLSAEAIADLQTTVDWFGLSIEPGVDYPGGYTGMNSQGWINNGESETGEQYVADTYLYNSIGANTSELQNEDDLLTAHSHSSSSGNADTSGWINGNIHRSFEFSVPDTGFYSFSLDYTVASQLSRDDGSESAINDWLFDLQIQWHDLSEDNWEIIASNKIVSKHDINSSPLLFVDDSGSIALNSVELIEGNIYSFGIQQGVSSFTESDFTGGSVSVPEPATLTLCIAGFIALMGFGIGCRKRK